MGDQRNAVAGQRKIVTEVRLRCDQRKIVFVVNDTMGTGWARIGVKRETVTRITCNRETQLFMEEYMCKDKWVKQEPETGQGHGVWVKSDEDTRREEKAAGQLEAYRRYNQLKQDAAAQRESLEEKKVRLHKVLLANDKELRKEQIKELVSRAVADNDSGRALQWSQAALNIANASWAWADDEAEEAEKDKGRQGNGGLT